MTTQRKSRSLTQLFATGVFAALALAGTAICAAGDNVSTPRVTVSYADLNLMRPQGAATLYARIEGAAHVVCGTFDGNIADLWSQELQNACIHKAIKDAVIEVGAAQLIAVYNARNREKLALMAMARRGP